MSLKIAIVDDCDIERKHIASLTATWGEKAEHTLALSCFSSAEAFLFEYEQNNDFDILLLDIEMKKMNGVELASRVREGNSTVQIIFITGYSDYIAAGYDVAALHYLMKPVNCEKFFSVLSRAAKKQGRHFSSTKGEGHGLGLGRIDSIVDRLGGYIDRNSEDGAFTTEILLPQE